MDQNSSTALKQGARARNGAAKARTAEARNTKARAVKARSALAKSHSSKVLVNGHGVAPELDHHELLNALHAMQAGDFSVRLPGHQTGVGGKICDAFNTNIAANQRIAQQLEHVGEVVGQQG